MYLETCVPEEKNGAATVGQNQHIDRKEKKLCGQKLHAQN